MQVIGNAGYKLSWAADPTPAPYWMSRALEHGFLRCTVNGTAFSCEVTVHTSQRRASVHLIMLDPKHCIMLSHRVSRGLMLVGSLRTDTL